MTVRIGRAIGAGACLVVAGCTALGGIEPPELACRVDGINDGDPYESDVDCGGSCQPCADFRKCFANRDCVSNRCAEYEGNKVCLPDDCGDGMQNGAESGVDCGGYCPACADGLACNTNEDCMSRLCTDAVCTYSCSDGVVDGTETGTDCGGGIVCPACGDGEGCAAWSDCTSYVCADPELDGSYACQTPNCADTVQNGDEEGVDCGGSMCAPCA